MTISVKYVKGGTYFDVTYKVMSHMLSMPINRFVFDKQQVDPYTGMTYTVTEISVSSFFIL